MRLKARYVILILGLWYQVPALAQKTNPTAPAQTYNHSQVQIQNEKHKSVVSIPVDIALEDIAKQINSQVNGLIYEDNSYTDDNNDQFKTKVWKRAPIRVEARDSLLYYVVPLKIWAEKGYSLNILGKTLAGYQDTEFAIDLKFMTSFGIEPDWKVKTKTASAGFDWVTKPVIKVSGIDIPITSIVSRKLNQNLGALSKAIDDNIRQNLDLKPYIQQAWNMIREPRLLSEEYRTWLLITPSQILMTPFVLKPDGLKANIGLQGFTQTLTGEKPTVAPLPILPLTISNKITQGFVIGIISNIPYKEATALASTKFVGQKFDFKESKYQIEVTNIEIYGQNDKLVIVAGVKGSLKGTIYLKGVPIFDPNTRKLSLKNVDFDLETRNLLFKTASWLLQSRFAKEIEEQFAFEMGSQLDEMQTEIQKLLTNHVISKGITLNGKLIGLSPDQVYLTPEALLAVTFAKGDLQVKIKGLF
jgi:Domain of unknown function (DUF4403)